jgi:hypothetical protein
MLDIHGVSTMIFHVDKYDVHKNPIVYWAGCGGDKQNQNPVAAYDRFLNGYFNQIIQS